MVNSKQSELILNGKLSKAIWFLAIPATINFFLEQFFQIIDIFWISKLGEDAIASMAVWTFLAWSLISSAQIVEIGVNSLVAKSWGAKDFDRAKSVANVGFHLILVVTIFVSLLTMAFSENLMTFMGLSESVKTLAFQYLDLMLPGFPFLGLIFVISAIFRGTGDTVTPLKLLAIVILINLILDPLLILGYFGFPKMGIFGAAVATVFSNIVGVVYGFYLLAKRGFYWKIRGFWDKILSFEIVKIGIPIAVNGFLFSYVYIRLTKEITNFGTTPVAALNLGHRIEGLLWPICLGFMVTTTSIIGQNLGAKNFTRVKKTAFLSAFYSSSICLVFGLVFIVFGETIAKLFTDNPELLKVTASYLKIIGYFEFFLGFELTFEGAFSGIGKTFPTVLISTPLNLLRIPLAIYLVDFYGVDGIWWAIGTTTALKGIFLAIWFGKTKINFLVQ